MENKTEKKTILVADDEPFILSALLETLSFNYRVFTVFNGTEAVSSARQHKPDLIIMDVLMPGMDGIEACKTLKNDKLTADIPVILLSAKGQITDIEKGFKCGVAAYIVKPFSPTRLMETVGMALEKFEAKKARENI